MSAYVFSISKCSWFYCLSKRLAGFYTITKRQFMLKEKVPANEKTTCGNICCGSKCFPVCFPGSKSVSEFVEKHFASSGSISSFERRRNISGNNRAVYTRENKPRLTLAAAYIIRERNYLYEYKLPGQDKPRLEKAVNVDFVPFIRGVRVLCKPRPE